MLDNVELQIKEVFSSHEIKVTSDDILEKVAAKKQQKKRFSFKWLMPALSGLVVATAVLAIVLIPASNPGDNKVDTVLEKVEQRAFVADVTSAAEVLMTQQENQAVLAESSLGFYLEEVLVEEIYANINQTLLSAFGKLDFKYETKEEKHTLNEVEYNYVCEISKENVANLHFYYNLSEDESNLNGIIYKVEEDDFLDFSVSVETTFTKVEDKIISTSVFTNQLFGYDLNTYTVKEEIDGTKVYSWYIEEEVVFEYVISENENGAIIEYETLIDKLSLNVVAQDPYIYKIDYTYVSKFVEAFPIQGQFIVTYEENYKNYEIEFIYPTN